MSRIGVEVTVELALRGPILVHSSEIGPWGVDAVALRDPAGRLLLPGDAVQGKVREAYDELGGDPLDGQRSRKQDMATLREFEHAEDRAADAAARYEAGKTENLDAKIERYPLFFSDFVAVDSWPAAGEQTISQTAIDADTGAAQEGSLRVFDCPVPAGKIAKFRGAVRFFCDDRASAEKPIQRLVEALRWIPSFGSQRSVGFGRNCDAEHQPGVQIVATEVTSFDDLSKTVAGNQNARSVLMDFTFQDPLCLPSGVINGNIYESRDEIPGETLRGALAELLKQIGGLPSTYSDLNQAETGHPFAALCHDFGRIRITTARPTADKGAKTVQILPKSLAFANKQLFDFALEADVNGGGCLQGEAAAFLHDWKQKEWKAANEYFQVVFPRQELRVRTAIDEAGKRRAKSHNLFAYRMVRPEGVSWHATVGIDDRTKAGVALDNVRRDLVMSQLLAVLQSGWLSVGKTRARGTGRPVQATPAPQPDRPLKIRGCDDDVFVLTLRGPALMIDPRQCVDEGCMKSLAEIDILYGKYWQEVSGGFLTEIPQRRFKTDSLVGGFQARKYRYSPDESFDMTPISNPEDRIKAQKQFPYNPTWIIDAGSVFVLKPSAGKKLADGQAKIDEWLAYGLPLPRWAKEAYGDTHHTNIFLPENGFGEIDVNLPCHQATFASPLTTTKG